ncbi:MAG: tRNA (adenosine(37)-N6)-threonylcarbamoyltransferase complex dimerization subunit type 1 TsaB [Candidatus Omnitrophota bacterium]
MNILSIDTSTKNFSLAVSKGGDVIVHRDVKLNGVLSSSIIPKIDEILRQARLTLKRIDGFGVGLGPGSFTSLRVGLSTVKALAFATRKPVVGISSLDIIAKAITGAAEKDICVMCDAKRNLVYACLYRLKGREVVKKSKYLLLPPKDLLGKIKRPTLFTGDAVGLYREEILREVRQISADAPEGIFAGEDLWYPQARYLAPLAYRKFQRREEDAIDALVPIYLYPKDCQVRKHNSF